MAINETFNYMEDLRDLWFSSGETRNPFNNLLVTPLFAKGYTMKLIRHWKEKYNENVYFDSGGFQCALGKIQYWDLFEKLLKYYSENSWADYYVLPDHPTLVNASQDLKLIVDKNVNTTIIGSELFYHKMQGKFLYNFIGVIQGYSLIHIKKCVKLYKKLNLSYMGLGPPITVDKSKRYKNIRILLNNIHKYTKNKIHLFGTSNFLVLNAAKEFNVFSCDSSAWILNGGYGNVSLPFFNTFYGNNAKFNIVKKELKHNCEFCDNYNLIECNKRINKKYIILHNLNCILDTLDIINGKGKVSNEEALSIRGKYVKRKNDFNGIYYQSSFDF
jgi:hypothetical protein